jgi:uncharacterized membrane protein
MPLLPFAAGIGAALIAGTFLAFSSFIMAALARLPPPQGIAAMQAINVTVLNPLFMFVLFGTAALCAWLAARGAMNLGDRQALLQGAGGAAYVLGVVGVTLALNVPLNNALAAIDAASSEGAAVWVAYLRDWTFWNHVRGLFAALSAALVFLAR